MRKKILLLIVALVIALAACASPSNKPCPAEGSSACDPQLPRLTTSTGHWVDMTGSVTKETMALLESESIAIEKDGFQLGGFIAANAISDPSKITSDFGNLNGLGSKEKDNGVAIVIFKDKAGNDGKKPYIFMAPGKGLSGLTATKLGQIRDNVFIPARAQGKWEQGLVDTVKAIHQVLSSPSMEEYKTPGSGDNNTGLIILIIVLLGLILLLAILGGGLNSSSDDDESGGGFFGGGGGGGFGGGGSFGGGGTGG